MHPDVLQILSDLNDLTRDQLDIMAIRAERPLTRDEAEQFVCRNHKIKVLVEQLEIVEHYRQGAAETMMN